MTTRIDKTKNCFFKYSSCTSLMYKYPSIPVIGVRRCIQHFWHLVGSACVESNAGAEFANVSQANPAAEMHHQ
jgi:hypothetical protein